MSAEQKADLNNIFTGVKNAGNLDYVSCWYKKSVQMMQGNTIRTALVATNSISQGEQATLLWKPLFEMGAHIDFAHRTFRWDSEANIKAHVHCVIIGFSIAENPKAKQIFDNLTSPTGQTCRRINAYLTDAPNVFIDNCKKVLCAVPPVNYGSFALDDGYYTISEEEYTLLKAQESNIDIYLRPFIGAAELLHKKTRYCVWLKDIAPDILKKSPVIMEKISKVKQWRSNSSRKNTVELANTPTLFAEIRQPDKMYLAIPTVCSEKRKYIPIAYLTPDIIASNQLYIIPDADLYHFGILTSNVHMAWMRIVAGRLKSDYRYSANIVYNNFPWCEPTEVQKAAIEKTAQAILDARALYPDCSLADLYDEATMPPELRRAHQANDRAVMKAYSYSPGMTEPEIVADLMKRYQKLTASAE